MLTGGPRRERPAAVPCRAGARRPLLRLLDLRHQLGLVGLVDDHAVQLDDKRVRLVLKQLLQLQQQRRRRRPRLELVQHKVSDVVLLAPQQLRHLLAHELGHGPAGAAQVVLVVQVPGHLVGKQALAVGGDAVGNLAQLLLEVDLLGWRRPGTGPALIPAVLALQLRQRLKGGQRHSGLLLLLLVLEGGQHGGVDAGALLLGRRRLGGVRGRRRLAWGRLGGGHHRREDGVRGRVNHGRSRLAAPVGLALLLLGSGGGSGGGLRFRCRRGLLLPPLRLLRLLLQPLLLPLQQLQILRLLHLATLAPLPGAAGARIRAAPVRRLTDVVVALQVLLQLPASLPLHLLLAPLQAFALRLPLPLRALKHALPLLEDALLLQPALPLARLLFLAQAGRMLGVRVAVRLGTLRWRALTTAQH
mmetsp:Transcript_19617/g.49553  ORF Transcript_19617/g.49553 Transcript_19617/m.49553 type:complete len:416 (+) Transcript_19617:228-1475(+)